MDLIHSFQKMIADHKLSHAYLFWGDPEFSFAENLANFLENRVWSKPQHPLIDFFIINGAAGIDEIKRAQYFLWQSPIKSSRKTLVISEADKLTPQAQNAMLKITEEPPKSALLLAFVRNQDLLAPALVSRFQKIYFPYKKSSFEISDDAKKFLNADQKSKGDIIKKVIEDDLRLEEFIKNIMAELAKDPIANFRPLKDLCYYWSLMCRYNTNKRLQLEAWTESLVG